MTRKLKVLVEDWHDEITHFRVVEKRFLNCVSNMSELNTQIYNECVKQGIDIKTLQLSDGRANNT